MSQQPYEPSPGDTTQELRNQQPPPQQQMWQGPPRAHLHIRSTFLTTEFWIFILVSLGILIAAGVDDGPGDLGFSSQEAWKYIAWLAVAYMLSRGLTKMHGARRDGGSTGTEV